MPPFSTRLVFFSVCLGLTTPAAFAQESAAPRIEFPDASPISTVHQRVGLTDFEITYSRPSVKGRKIFGGLEPFGSIWRTGANAATTVTFNTPVIFAGAEVPAGKYALFTIPDREEWTFILNKEHEQWGAFRYDRAQDAVRVKVRPVTLERRVESLTIGFDELRETTAELVISWENTRVAVPVAVDVQSKVIPQIEAVMATPEKKLPNLYFNSAQFYLEHGGDLVKALAWTEEALAMNAKAAPIVHLKARILAKLGRTAEARQTAEQWRELALAARDALGAKRAEDFIATLQ